MSGVAGVLPSVLASRRNAEVGMALAVVLVIALLIIPLPAFLLDLCLALSISLSLVVLLVALYTTDPLDFSAFPALILANLFLAGGTVHPGGGLPLALLSGRAAARAARAAG